MNINHAEGIALATGSSRVTYKTERRNTDGSLTTESVEMFGNCLNCGERAYQKGESSARHAGTHKIGCSEPTIGSLGVCAALTND